MRLSLALLLSLALVATACGDDGESATPPSSTSNPPATTLSTTTTTTSATTTTTTTTSATTTTTVPAPVCESAAPLAVIDGALAVARVAGPSDWSADPAATPFVTRTAAADEYADRLGLDCGLLVAASEGTEQWLAIAAWTGPRMAFAVQTTDGPTDPFRAESFVRNPVTEDPGEFLADDMSLWAVTGPDGESIVLGHVDFSLGAASKDWEAGPRIPFEEEINLPAERHAIDTLEAAGMRNVGIAQPPELDSEEGYAQFVSPTGQISVADVAPTDWFDPMRPRYYTGETTIETIDGANVRITMADPDDNLGFIQAAEVAFACDAFVWILEPPFNGSVDEMIVAATAILGTQECRADV